MKQRQTKPERMPVLALYQRFLDDEDRTAALLRNVDEWVVCGVNGELGGAWEVTVHERLEDARAAIIEWVGEPREVTEALLASTVRAKIEQFRETGNCSCDPLPRWEKSGPFV